MRRALAVATTSTMLLTLASTLTAAHAATTSDRAPEVERTAAASSVKPSATKVRPRAGNRLACDFDGDGFSDQPVGARYKRVGKHRSAGAVHVIYGAPKGFTARGDQVLTRATKGVRGRTHGATRTGAGYYGPQFGSTLVCGNFNGDRFADLAVGSPFDYVRAKGRWVRYAGTVHVFHGSRRGLSVADDQLWHGNSPGVPGGLKAGEWEGAPFGMGAALAAGDFDGDGRDDLAVDHGFVLRGTKKGLAARPKAPRFPRASRLAAGDVDADGRDDLVVDGTVHWGTPRGVRADLRTLPSLPSSSNHDDEPKLSLSDVADFDGDGYGDFAISAARTDDEVVDESRRFQYVLHVSFGGPRSSALRRTQRWHPDLTATPGSFTVDAGSAGDLDGDGDAELVVSDGVVLEGGPQGLSTPAGWRPGDGLVDGVGFGDVGNVVLGDHDGDGLEDATGTIHRDHQPYGFRLLPGSREGLTTTGSQRWHQGRKGVRGKADRPWRYQGDGWGLVLGQGQ